METIINVSQGGLKIAATSQKQCKVMKFKIVSLFFVGVIFLMTACQQNEFKSQVIDFSAYLEIDGDIDDDDNMIETGGLYTYRLATQRVLSVAVQQGRSVSFLVDGAEDLNISDRLFTRITQAIREQIKSSEFVLAVEKGQNVVIPKKRLKFTINRLKSGEVEKSDSLIKLDEGNLSKAVVDGFKNASGEANMNDIWDMSTGSWGTSYSNPMMSNFTWNGYSGSVFINTGCFSADQNCSGNNIGNIKADWNEGSNSGSITINDCSGPGDGITLARINIDTRAGYEEMCANVGIDPDGYM